MINQYNEGVQKCTPSLYWLQYRINYEIILVIK